MTAATTAVDPATADAAPAETMIAAVAHPRTDRVAGVVIALALVPAGTKARAITTPATRSVRGCATAAIIVSAGAASAVAGSTAVVAAVIVECHGVLPSNAIQYVELVCHRTVAKRTKGGRECDPLSERMPGGVLLSHTVTSAVPSALKGLASGFGM